MIIDVRTNLKPVQRMIVDLGLHKDGDAQKHWTMDVMRRMVRYMPYRTGTMATKLTFMRSSTEIETAAPGARMLYHGKVMVDAKTGKGPMNIPGVGLRYKKGTILKVTDRDLQYDQTKNPLAGPKWDQRLVAAEGDQMVADLQTYLDRKKGKK